MPQLSGPLPSLSLHATLKCHDCVMIMIRYGQVWIEAGAEQENILRTGHKESVTTNVVTITDSVIGSSAVRCSSYQQKTLDIFNPKKNPKI